MSTNAVLQSVLASLPELFVLLAASLLLVWDLLLKRNHGTVLARLTLLVLPAAAWLTLHATGSSAVFYNGMYVADGYALFFKLLFYLATALTVLLSMNYLKLERADRGEYYVLLLFALGGMMILASATDLLIAYVGLELIALSVYVLTGFLRIQPRANEAALKYVVVSAVASALLLYGISLFYGLTGSTRFADLAAAFSGTQALDPAVVMATLFIVAGFAFKIAAVPFHMWAPDVYEGAPTAITAFMSVGPKAAGFAVLLRVFLDALAPLSSIWLPVLAVMAVATLAVGSLVALVQTNIKRMLAYSSVAHVGFALLGLVAGGADGIASVMVYMLIYTVMNVGAFAVIIALRNPDLPLGDYGDEDIASFAGLAKQHRGLAVLMLIFMFSLAGVPPTAGFFGKFYVFIALVHHGHIALAVIAVLFSAVAAFFYLRIVMLMYMREPDGEFRPSKALSLRIALAVTAALTLGIGLFPSWFLELAQHSVF